MFQGIAGIDPAYVLCGVIWAIVLGFAAGNYACSLVHRLPRGRLLLDQKPYCGTCGAPLQVKDLFPVFSALLLRHKCRYCRTPFPVSHTWTEIMVGLLFVLAFFAHNFSENFIMIVTLGVFLITLVAIHANEEIILGKVMLCVIVTGMVGRTLWDHSIYNFFEGGFLAMLLGIVLWRKQIKPLGHVYSFPAPVKLLAAGGICVGKMQLPVFLLLYGGIYGVDWLLRKATGSQSKPLMTLSFGFATLLPVLYPGLQAYIFNAGQ